MTNIKEMWAAIPHGKKSEIVEKCKTSYQTVYNVVYERKVVVSEDTRNKIIRKIKEWTNQN